MLEVRDLGRMRYGDALAIQQDLVEQRKQGLISDQLVFVEHPHVITQGRNGSDKNLLASDDTLASAGIEYFPTNRGGDITYHGPGQIVGYPILDLREWKRDVVAYVRAIEQVIIDVLADFSIAGQRVPGCTGVWVEGKKVAAIGIHVSRWVTSHGFALNHSTDLRYFQYIVPCGLTKPVTSMQELGSDSSREQVLAALSTHFARQFDRNLPSRDREGTEAGVSYTETYS
jgi:lipoyl(octanoyl) transferase